MKQKIAVLGPGSWGTALSEVLAENGHEVRLWGHEPAQIDEINNYHTNRHYLPDLKINEAIKGEKDLAKAITGVDAILFVVPTKATRQVAQRVAKIVQGRPYIIHASKGLEQGSHKRLSEVLAEEIPADKRKEIVVLSGPSHAEEVAVHDITTITAASTDQEAAEYVQATFMNEYFRVYTNNDVVGVETGAALKNIIAIGAGAIAGLGFGDNAKAAIITRGLTEISRLGVAMGADPLTFSGLSGVGDLIVTCTSVHSRNWRAGNMLGKGQNLQDILENMGMIVEGVSTTKAAMELAQSMQVEMPITETIYRVLYENKDIHQAAHDIMMRDGKMENEFSQKGDFK
ncbi:MAG TPA: NAD(P)H-dependent glycerol-3-phosphate dehydrogenase [Tetragenococcus sp.]|nr:NAD(P)H-dependent glycerol-3-phosphate dehydrogenase [Tetragenococcus sp.]